MNHGLLFYFFLNLYFIYLDSSLKAQKITKLRLRYFFIQAAGLVYHHRAKRGAYHQPYGLYLITRQRASPCGFMRYNTACW